MNYGRERTEPYRDPPHQVVVALEIVEPPGAPATKEATELMTEEHDAPQHRHMRGTEHVTNKATGKRNRAKPKEPERRREQQNRDPSKGQSVQFYGECVPYDPKAVAQSRPSMITISLLGQMH